MVTCYIEEHEVSVHMFYNDKQAAPEKEAILKCVYEYEKTLKNIQSGFALKQSHQLKLSMTL